MLCVNFQFSLQFKFKSVKKSIISQKFQTLHQFYLILGQVCIWSSRIRLSILTRRSRRATNCSLLVKWPEVGYFHTLSSISKIVECSLFQFIGVFFECVWLVLLNFIAFFRIQIVFKELLKNLPHCVNMVVKCIISANKSKTIFGPTILILCSQRKRLM